MIRNKKFSNNPKKILKEKCDIEITEEQSESLQQYFSVSKDLLSKSNSDDVGSVTIPIGLK